MKESVFSAKTISVIKRAFREYYFKQSNAIEEPSKMDQREFGYMQFGQAGMVRHLSFKSMKELHAMLVREAPSDVYCSNAYYHFPTQQPMQEKQWLGADLIFDIDGKDLELPCVPSHSYSLCINCGYALPPTLDDDKEKLYSCPSCGYKKADYVSISCPKCIDASKKEVRRLIEFLIVDLGMQQSDIHIYFSGNNGFHIHINHDAYTPLDPQARSDLVGYLSGTGLMVESIGVRKSNKEDLFFIKFPKSGLAYGWRRRIADKLKIDTSSTIKLKYIVTQNGGYSAFKIELDRMAKDMGVRLDPQVTTDVHRVFRMPGTLNGKSGLAKAKCSDLYSFDPFVDACQLGDGKVSVRLKAAIKLKLMGKSFNISKESAEMPAYAAVYLMCKGLAEAN
jgi:DNA primase small subunit